MINTNLSLILHSFQVVADFFYQIFASYCWLLHFNTLTRGDPLRISG